MQDIRQNIIINVKSETLFFLTLSYTMILAFANWFDARLINLYGLETSGGTLIFPITFLISDLITEVYGYKNARRAIWYGFLFNIIYILYGQLIIHLPDPGFSTNSKLFDTVLSINTRVIIASIFSYLISEPINSMILSTLKIRMHGRHIWFRFVTSTIFSSFIDSIIFCISAFYGTVSNQNIFLLILTGWLCKIITEIIGLPISMYLSTRLKQHDHIDIYDTSTRFNLFSLDTSYSQNSNHFKNTYTSIH